MRGAVHTRQTSPRRVVESTPSRPFERKDNDYRIRECSAASDAPPVADGSISEVWREYTISRSPTLRNMLIIHYMNGHVRRIAGRLRAQLPPQVDVDDLVDEAYEGLVHAITTFDPTMDVRFETFSSKRLFGAMRDYLRRIDPVPRLTRTRAKHTAALIDTFTVRHGRPPHRDELRLLLRQSVCAKFRKSCGRDPDAAEQIKLDKIAESTFRKFTLEGRPALMISYNGDSRGSSGGGGNSGGGEDDGDAMASFQARDLRSPLDRAELADLRRWITQGFPRRDRLIIILYYYEHLTMKEIGQTIGCSESRVSQRLESILQCLRSRLERTGRECEFYRK